MLVKIPFPLTLDYVRSAPTSALFASLQSWVKVSDPTCLLHPHGFAVVLLRSGFEDWRLHWWPKGPRTLTGMPGMIHTHDKIIESRILTGQIENVLYDVSAVPTGGQSVYEVAYAGNKYIRNTANVLQKTAERVQASASNIQTLKAGDCYRIENHVYHEAIVPDDAVTATIVCMHSPSPGPIKVIGLDGYPEQLEFQRIECRAVECMGLD